MKHLNESIGQGWACVPEAVLELTQLVSLDLSYNALEALPPEIATLRNLEELYLAHNNLATLPAAIGALSRLSALNIKHVSTIDVMLI